MLLQAVAATWQSEIGGFAGKSQWQAGPQSRSLYHAPPLELNWQGPPHGAGVVVVVVVVVGGAITQFVVVFSHGFVPLYSG